MGLELGLASPRAISVIERARQRAMEREQEHLGAEHLFLALLEEKNGIPAQLLAEFVDVEAVRQRLVELLDSDEYRTPTDRQIGGDDS